MSPQYAIGDTYPTRAAARTSAKLYFVTLINNILL